MCVEWCKPSCVDAPYVNRCLFTVLVVGKIGILAHYDRNRQPPCPRTGQGLSISIYIYLDSSRPFHNRFSSDKFYRRYHFVI